jgi:ubiquinone/menaquinone biosynthesis C-methylase UbiE
MRNEDYNLMHALEADHWWFVGMREVTSALLSRWAARAPRDILDVGCGTGINLLWMAQQFRPERVTGCDFSPAALRWCCETVKSARSYSQKVIPRMCRGDARKLPFAPGSFDLVTCLDVLDLFPPDEDRAAMAELHRVLRPDGVALVREPAYQWLISSHDYLFETRHRYTTFELRSKMTAAGFQVLRATYANTILFPAAMTQRLLRKFLRLAADKTDTQPWPRSLEWLNGIFKACLHVEALQLARGLSLPFGLSAIVVARKPA